MPRVHGSAGRLGDPINGWDRLLNGARPIGNTGRSGRSRLRPKGLLNRDATLERLQVPIQRRVELLHHQRPERLPLASLTGFERIDVATALLRLKHDRRIATLEQHRRHEEPSRAPVPVAERVDLDQARMRLERRIGRWPLLG